MEIIKYPERKDWNNLLLRPAAGNDELVEKVSLILEAVKQGGDAAVRKYTREFDGTDLQSLEVSATEWTAAHHIPDVLKKAIQLAASNIIAFHEKQIEPVEVTETMPGVQCWRRSVAIDKVGLYIPGGTAPLFSSLLMTGIPAIIAGCREIIVCTPPGKDGKLDPALLYTASWIGIKRLFKVGGVQAIAAMTYGTESIPPVYKIVGPGNRYVTVAKQQVQQQGIAIDMPAGPSEVCILADRSANPAFIAADLLAQAEHGSDSQVLLVTTMASLIPDVMEEISKQVQSLPRKAIALQALENSKLILVKDIPEAIDLVNEYAPEHLILNCQDVDEIANKIINAGSVFIGNYSPETVGDYASGTNHTLPTNGYAKAYSGVSTDTFLKKITYQKLDHNGLKNIAQAVITMAEAEGLQGHANAVKIRL